MKVSLSNYVYWVCPYCGHKHWEKVLIFRMPPVTLNGTYEANGKLCMKCRGFYKFDQAKRIIDRAEMRRDMNKLQKLLERKRK